MIPSFAKGLSEICRQVSKANTSILLQLDRWLDCKSFNTLGKTTIALEVIPPESY
jgi:hypothetical protein